jgi:hypothetical protein
MGIKYLSNINLNLNEIQNIVIQNLNSVPITSAIGQIYYDTIISKLKLKTATGWITINSGASEVGPGIPNRISKFITISTIGDSLIEDNGTSVIINKPSGSTSIYKLDVNGTIYSNAGITGNSFIKIGGTSSQYLMADGSVSTGPSIPTVGTWGALNYPTWVSGTPFVKMTAAGTFTLDTILYYPNSNPSGFIDTTYVAANFYPLTGNPSNFITSSALSPYLLSSTAATTYFPIPTGTTLEYIRGNGSLATLPTNTFVSLTTTGSSGSSTLTSGVLNVPTYTLSGLGGQAQLNGTGFVKASGTTITYDNTIPSFNVTTPTGGDLLVYNGSTEVWENKDTEYIKRQTQRVVETDFMVPSTSAAVQFPYVFTLINSGALNSSSLTNGINPGILRLRSATVATPNSGAHLLPLGSSLNTGLTKIFSNAQIDFIFRTPGTLVGTGINLRFGLGQSASSTTDIDNGYYIEMIENSLYGKTADGSTRSQTPTSYTTAINTWYHGRVKYISSSLVEYSLYNMAGNLLWSDTLTTNITTSNLNPLIIAISTNNAAGIDLVICDYFSATYPVSNRGALN